MLMFCSASLCLFGSSLSRDIELHYSESVSKFNRPFSELFSFFIKLLELKVLGLVLVKMHWPGQGHCHPPPPSDGCLCCVDIELGGRR